MNLPAQTRHVEPRPRELVDDTVDPAVLELLRDPCDP